MNRFGRLELNKEFVFCGHPGKVADYYRFPLKAPGWYDVFVEQVPNDRNSPDAFRIQLSIGISEWMEKGALIQSSMSGEGIGVMICDSEKFKEVDVALSNNIMDDPKLWNFFGWGLILRGDSEYLFWKLNSPDGNVVFVPSEEYYYIYEGSHGYIIECDMDFEGKQRSFQGK